MRARLRGPALLLGCALGALAAGPTACTAPAERAETVAQSATDLDRVEWLEKTAKVLRNGRGLGPSDDIEALAAIPRSDVVDLWMRDPAFGDAVLAFNLYYLGRSVEQVKRPTSATAFAYDPVVFEVPQALAAARAAVSDGNFFDLYSGTPDFVYPQESSFPGPEPFGGTGASTGSGAVTLPDGERQRVLGLMDAAIAAAPADAALACGRFAQAGLQATNDLRLMGFPPALRVRQLWLRPQPDYPLSLDCASGAAPAIVASMRAIRGAIERMWTAVEARRRDGEVRTVADLSSVPAGADGLPPLVAPLGPGFFARLPSTSTNFQRKRAAHVLKTYFCDDLTPLDVPAVEAGDGGADGGAAEVHASSPSCQGCHYRLDPIGALFRNVGSGGFDHTGEGKIRFDDGIVFEGAAYDRYLGQWRNPDGTFRAGYWVLRADGTPERERGWTDANGDTLRGLWTYMRRSPLVKECLVRRLAEYVLGPQQVYDREWLAEVSAGFGDGPASGAHFRRVLKSLVLSRTFAIHNPEHGVCYDAPASAPPNRSPCAIAHVVSANCATCHASTGGPGRLDFKTWKDLGDGTFSWAHLDAQGNQLPRAESLRRMLDRITTLDRDRRMPRNKAMSGDDFTTFRSWLTTGLENTP